MMLFMICAFSNCWWPMFTFIVYVMTPIPLSFMMASCGNRDVEGSDPMESGGNGAFFKRIMAEFGTCLSGALFSTLIGLPITLMHNDVGQMGTTNWWVGMVWIFANLIVMVSLMVAVVSIRAPSGSSSY
jgi:formate hydrogenlyase subunit 4